MTMLTAPEIHYYCDILDHRSIANFNSQVIFDAKTYQILDIIGNHIKQIMPREGTTGIWDLWFQAPRSPIEKFGDYQEWLEAGEVSNYEEFQEIWLSCFPDEEYWYPFTTVERKEDQYRGIFLNHRMMIEQRGDPSTGVPLDIHKFAAWLLQSVDTCIHALKNGNYNQFIETHLPIQHRTGTILRKDWWSIFPDIRKEFLSDLSQENIALFTKYMEEPGQQNTAPPLKEMSTNDYFRVCAIGYAANHYSGGDQTPREQYYLHADGRDDGLSEIDPDSPSAFLPWFIDPNRQGGHPWEIA